MTDQALRELWAHFEALYARRGRPSIAAERLLRALLLQILYSIRSERQLMRGRPSYLGHVLIENRKGLVVAACATQSSTTAEREAALAMLAERGRNPGNEAMAAITLGADKLYQEEKFIVELRRRKVIPHVAEYESNEQWPNWLTEEERQHPGFAISQKKRKLVEKVFGWGKLDSILRQVKVNKVDWFFRLLATAANLVRMVKLIPAV